MAMNGNNMGDEVIAAIQAIPDFPEQGKTANVIDPRVIRAICSAVVAHIQANADVLPVSHSGEDLSAPTGQLVTIPSTANPGNPSTGETTADKEVVGMGSIQ